MKLLFLLFPPNGIKLGTSQLCREKTNSSLASTVALRKLLCRNFKHQKINSSTTWLTNTVPSSLIIASTVRNQIW